jgi:hypothetical protein
MSKLVYLEVKNINIYDCILSEFRKGEVEGRCPESQMK